MTQKGALYLRLVRYALIHRSANLSKMNDYLGHFMKESSSPSEGIDRVDRKILQLLQRDGRMSNAELAKAVNVSPATCHRRTQRLFDDGYIRSIRAELAPEKLERS